MAEIIAEVAQGFEGNPTLARLLAKGAVAAGADAVKYQLVYADELATPDYRYHGLFRSLEMAEDDWRPVVDLIRASGKKVYFDVYGEQGLDMARRLTADGIKISTTEFYNDFLVRQVTKHFSRIFIAVGGVPPEDIGAFIARHGLRPSSDICFMYGVQNLPTRLEDSHILRLRSLSERFPGFAVGLMDHVDGGAEDALVLPLLALPLGVGAIEKHITLDHLLEIEDYVSGLTPTRFRKLVEMVRRFEPALGHADMELTEQEKAYKQRTAKVAVARRPLRSGAVLGSEDVALKRVGRELDPGSVFQSLSDVLDQTILVDLEPNEPLLAEMLGRLAE